VGFYIIVFEKKRTVGKFKKGENVFEKSRVRAFFSMLAVL